MKIGILAVQGSFAEHEQMLDRLHTDHFQIRNKQDLLNKCDGLIIPGGESTAMAKLLHELDLFDELRRRIQGGLPVYGTCAGLILLARRISGESHSHLATMDITCQRNAYGRQLGSFQTQAMFAEIAAVPMVFIRAPYIESVEHDAQILATVSGQIVAARQGRQLVTAFHPELTEDATVHRYFLEQVCQTKCSPSSAETLL